MRGVGPGSTWAGQNVDSLAASRYILASFPPSRLCKPAQGMDLDQKERATEGVSR